VRCSQRYAESRVHIPYALYIKIGIPVTLAAILLSIVTLNLEFILYQLLTS